MVEPVQLEVVTDNVRVFDAVVLPKRMYSGAVEFYVIRPDGIEQKLPASALIRVDRATLEALGEKIAPNLAAVDFGVLQYIERGDIKIRR